jgi:predicted phage terminase large subunit-like protein
MDLQTKSNGGIFATSVGGTLTGRGGDIIVIDDPMKASDLNSVAEMNRIADWYRESVVSRLNDRQTGVIIIVMQRLHVLDLVGQVLGLDDWDHLNLPAIAQADMCIPISDEQQAEVPKGFLLHEERLDSATLEQIRKSIGTYNFNAQYLQNPLQPEGNLVKRTWFGQYQGQMKASDFDYVLHSWDPAIGGKTSNDYAVCTVWGRREQTYFLLDVFREHLDFPGLAKKIQRLAQRDNPTKIIIESAGGGQAMLQQLVSSTNLPVAGRMPKGDKQARLEAVSVLIESGRVLLPASADWLECFLAEICGFPGGAYDDQVDSMTQALMELNAPGLPVLTVTSYPSFFGNASDTVTDRYRERTGISLFR